MAYILEEDTTLHFTGGPLKPKGWCIHWWGDPAQKPTFDAIKRVLVNRSAAQSASINFMCEAGRVACLVSPFTIAWGQGDGATGWGNNNLVSVEMNPRCTAGDRETLAELIADQNIINGIPIVLYPHNKFNATQCPGTYERYFPEILARAKQIVQEKTMGIKAQGGIEEDMAGITLEQIAQAVWSFKNPNAEPDRDAYQILRDKAENGLTNLYGTNITLGDQVAHIDKNLNDARALLLAAITGMQSVTLTAEDMTALADSLKESLAPGLASELAKRLTD